VASESSTRLWRVCKEAGRAWPTISEDPVLDFMVMEAVAIKVKEEDKKLAKEAEKEAKRKKFKEDKSGLEQYR